MVSIAKNSICFGTIEEKKSSLPLDTIERAEDLSSQIDSNSDKPSDSTGADVESIPEVAIKSSKSNMN